MAGVTIDLRTTVTITDTDGDSEEIARKVVLDKTITGAEVLAQKRLQIQNVTGTLWSAAGVGEPVTSFQCAILFADVVVDVELTAADGDADENRFCLRLQPGFPLILGDDFTTEREAGGDAFAGTAADITLIKVKERNNVLATVQMIIVKP